ncbi:hypothetical protein B0H13DRAFT_2087072 [Mycena leptocephala]|nr:hypothetical protein B0H13DRAFT_2087072 [Mycena leptocephala]
MRTRFCCHTCLWIKSAFLVLFLHPRTRCLGEQPSASLRNSLKHGRVYGVNCPVPTFKAVAFSGHRRIPRT